MTAPCTELPIAPPEATAVFGDQLSTAVRYAELLAGPGVERGLLGPREPARMWERHVLNCAGLAELLEPGQVVLDLGSGAGLPGVVLGVLRDDVTIELVEPLLRRATFLSEVVDELGLKHVTVRRARGEELRGTVSVDVVTARAVAPMDRLAGWAMPLLRAGGRLLALKGEAADSELDQTRPALRKAGAQSAEVVTVGCAAQLTSARVVVVVRGPGAVDRRRTEQR
ncbi:MAG: 16S rRNA (guanine(527)-N(7))-methyltransferase RsmG [Mycobacteriales bacterium]